MTTPTPDVNALIERLEKREAEDRKCAENNTVVADLLKPQMDAFDARGKYNLYAVRMELEHSQSAKRDSQYADGLAQAAQALRTLQARVGELTEVVTWLAERPTIEEVMNQGLSVVSLEECIRMMGERKLEHDEMVQRARTLTSQEAQRHGE